MKKVGFFKKIVSFLVAFMMVLSVSFAFLQKSYAATPKGYITVSIEKFTLGLGYIVEPIIVPFYEGDNGAKIILRVMDEYGLESQYTGSENDTTGLVENGFYLASIQDNDDRDVTIPEYIVDQINSENGEIEGRIEEGWLGEFDYTFMSGWMYSVNNIFPNFGAAMYKPKNNDVMRWQFTVWGYGADLGAESEWGADPYRPIANKDKLTTKVAEINSSANRTKLLANSNVKKAYNDAMTLLQSMTSTQAQVNSAYTSLDNAVKEATAPTPLPVIATGVTTNSLNVRKGSSTSYATLGKLSEGTKIEIVEKLSNGWYKIKYNGDYGYVSGKYVKLDEDEPPTPPVVEPEVIATGVTTNSLNVRKGSSTSYAAIGKLAEGTKIEIVEKLSNGWYKIKYNGDYGYVSGKYVKLDSDTPTPNPGVIATGVTTSGVNVRKGTSSSYSKLGYLTKGTSVEILEKTSNGWYKIKYNGSYGYVSGKYVKLT